ncbi:hypothetical protein GCM10023091_35490 [Ravibacter arvi]|uniref:Dienelactone hydrolase domain-containing protein n=1 Tax=Ravibacter arvi TaxID=2051041 RepID=A0ABP8M5B3_9BACT
MKQILKISVIAFLLSIHSFFGVRGQDVFIRDHLKGRDLDWRGDLSNRMVTQIDTFLSRKTELTRRERQERWLTAMKGNELSRHLEVSRGQLKKIWGMTGMRKKPHLEIETAPATLKQVRVTAGDIDIFPVTLQVTEGLEMKGLLLRPKAIKARVVMVPDADQTPEELAGIPAGGGAAPALQLARQGVQVLVPALISRKQVLSGSPSLGIYTNQPHREWLYRQSFDLGRHVIGYELQKIAACIDWFELENERLQAPKPIAIAGYGEGGMLALFTAAVDTRLSGALISGYLEKSESLWQRPIYRNLHGNLRVAGNAELLALSSHAKTVIEYTEGPLVTHPAPVEGRRGGAAPGVITTPPLSELNEEIAQAVSYGAQAVKLVTNDGKPFQKAFSTQALKELADVLRLGAPSRIPEIQHPGYWVESGAREKTLFLQMENISQQTLDTCEKNRNRSFWSGIRHHPERDIAFKSDQRERLHQLIGKINDPLLAPSPRVRLLESNDKWRQYEVVLDVWEGVFTWGILTVPVSAGEGAPLPAVVCQHGLEGLPRDMITRDPADRLSGVYKAVALGLAERGYVTFAPHNPYRGEHLFRTLQRKANPIGLSLFSVIAGQHQQIVNWLGSLSFIDNKNIGFYGLSYGGKTAMRIPALVEGYALSICSGDFNEWIRKVSTTRAPFSYQFTKEYEIYEWDLGNQFNYAEMAALIAPRPFMVEYGYKDGIGTAEWIGYEFGKVRKHYDISGLGDRLDIDLFNGVHEINAVKTYPFLDRHLKKQKP